MAFPPNRQASVLRSISVGLVTSLPDRFNLERAFGQWPQQLGFGLGQVEPGGPVLRAQHRDLAVVVRLNIGAWRGGQHGEGRLGPSPSVSRQRPAIAMNGASFRAKRCLAFG